MSKEKIRYDLSKKSTPEWIYQNFRFLFYTVGMFVLGGLCWYYIFVMGESCLLVGSIFIAYLVLYGFYVRLWLRGRKHMVYRATLEGTVLFAESADGVRTMDIAQTILMVGYSTPRFVSVVLISETDYLVINLSSVYAFSAAGNKKIKPFYAIAKLCKDLAPRYENVVRSNRAKRHPWIKVPFEIFEFDCRSRRVEKYVQKLRDLSGTRFDSNLTTQ